MMDGLKGKWKVARTRKINHPREMLPHLPFSTARDDTESPLPPDGSHLIISDTLNSPANFAVFHLLSAALQAKRKILWVDVKGTGRSNIETVLKKIGQTLPPFTSPLFDHISPTSLSSVIPSNEPRLSPLEDPGLREVYMSICEKITGASSTSSMIILDGLTELVWLGYEPQNIARFVRALQSQCRKKQATLISSVHADHLPLVQSSTSNPDPKSLNAELLERLIRQGGGGWWRISNLSSGRSGDVHGEISSHPLFKPDGLTFPEISRYNPLQYRLEDRTVKVFPKGTGRGFL